MEVGAAMTCEIIAHGQFGEIKMIAMARKNYAYTYVHHGIDRLSFEVKFTDGSEVWIGGHPVASGERTDAFPLLPGRNVIGLKVKLADENTVRVQELKVFRACPTPAWEKMIDQAAWSPRDSAGELIFKDHMWIMGGYVPEYEKDVWQSADGVSWTKMSDIPTSIGLDIPIALVFQDKMMITDANGVLFGSNDGEQWEVVTNKGPLLGRRSMGGAVFKGRMWVMGGQQGNRLLNDIWSSADGVHWVREVEQAPWSKRQITHNLLVYNDKLWLLGGGALTPYYYPFVAQNDVWCSSDGIHWECATAHAPWPARIWGSTVVYKNRMWMIGGYQSAPESRHFGDVWYSADGVKWLPFEQHASCWINRTRQIPLSVPAGMWEDRHEASALVHDDALYLMGGMIWPLKNDVWKLEIPGLCFLSQPVMEGYVDCLYEYRAFADFSPHADRVQYRLIEAPDWLTIDEDSGWITGTATEPSEANVIIEAFDGYGEVARQEYTLYMIPFTGFFAGVV